MARCTSQRRDLQLDSGKAAVSDARNDTYRALDSRLGTGPIRDPPWSEEAVLLEHAVSGVERERVPGAVVTVESDRGDDELPRQCEPLQRVGVEATEAVEGEADLASKMCWRVGESTTGLQELHLGRRGFRVASHESARCGAPGSRDENREK
jgi:hypothetical protein